MKPDIYNDLDKNLYRVPSVPAITDVDSGNLAGSFIGDLDVAGNQLRSVNYKAETTGWRLGADGNLEANDGTFRGDLVIGGLSRTIDSTGDIQTALDALEAAGGGTLYLKAGVWTVTSNITVPSGVAIVGVAIRSTIINFNSTAAHFIVAGTSAYSTGTITSITSNVTVTGSGTAWNTNSNVTTGHQFFIANRWYRIASVDSDTQITLTDPYAGGATFPGAAYRAAIVKENVKFANMTMTSSTGTALDIDDVRNIEFSDVWAQASNKGAVMDYVSEMQIDNLEGLFNTSNGIELNNTGYAEATALVAAGNGGHGIVMSNVRIISVDASASTGNTSDGYNLTDVKNVSLLTEASSNGGQGIELVSGCERVTVYASTCSNNGSDGYKLTGTCDQNQIIGTNLIDNGGYGVNIAASTCDNNTIVAPIFSGNSSGTISDAGTSTVIIQETDPKFGGTGADGALTISSGTTTIDLASDAFVIKNYSSISITGTGQLAFSNPASTGTIVILKSQGNVTITSSGSPAIDMRSLGASGGGGATAGGGGSNSPGGGGGASLSASGSNGGNGSAGQTGNLGTSGTGATAPFVRMPGGVAASSVTGGAGGTTPGWTSDALYLKMLPLAPGAGGAGGNGANTATGGAGGRGAGSLYIECGGEYNCTGTIDASGANGGTGIAGGGRSGGGGGGGGGIILVLYDSLNTDSGTYTVTGGTGGSDTGGAGNNGGNGGAGFAVRALNDQFA